MEHNGDILSFDKNHFRKDVVVFRSKLDDGKSRDASVDMQQMINAKVCMCVKYEFSNKLTSYICCCCYPKNGTRCRSLCTKAKAMFLG